MSEPPEPLTAPDCDCTDLDGFMLNVERLMASELVAVASHEAIAGALFLWCRAWKQTPAASLPDDERVLAAFARLPLPRFRKLRADVLHGFVKCSDGRLYHPVLAGEATRAFARKAAFRKRRETDAERLRKWRETQRETSGETANEARFVAEGQGQGQGQVFKERKKENETGVSLARAPRACRLPSDWFPDNALRIWTTEGDPAKAWPGITAAMMAVEIEKFRDYWHAKPGKDAAKLDWPATWRGWVRKAVADLELRPRSAPAVRRDNGWL